MADDMLHITIGGPPVDTSTDVGFQPASAPAPAPDDVGFQPAPTPPKLPDTAPIVAQVQQNIAAQPAPADNAQPQMDAQKIDAGLGFQVTAALKGGDGTFPPAARAGLVQAYQNSTATTAGDYAQSVLPTAAGAATSPSSHYAQEAGRDALGMASWSNPYTIGAHLFDIPLNVGALGMGFALRANPNMLDNVSKYLPQLPDIFGDHPSVPTFGELFDKIGAKLFPNGAADSDAANIADQVIQFGGAGGLMKAPTLALKAWNAFTGAAVGAGGQFSQEKAQQWAQTNFPGDTLTQSAISQAAGLLSMVGTGTALHAAGHTALAPTVADVVGKPVDAVTPQDTNQVIDKTFTPQNPKAQDFHDVATVMNTPVDTLHQTYAETGVHPDQVWEDAKNNPAIAADIQAGQVPDAYHDLRPATPVESGEAPGISASDIGELENVHAALSRRDAQLQDSAAKISSSLGDLNNLLSEMPRGAVSDQVQAALDQVKEMVNSLGSNDNFNEEKLANTFHDLSDRLGFIRQNITDTNVNKAASAIIDKISDIFLDREMSGGFLARDVADINRKFPGAGTDAKSLQDRIDKESRAWEERNRSRNEAIANKRANDLVNMAIEKQNTEEPEPTAGDQDALQEGGGQGGRGSEPPRGGGAGEPKEGPLTQPPALKDPRTFEDQLHQLSTNITADKLDIMKRAEAMPDLPSETWEKLYAYDENDPNVKLTPEEQAIYDEHIKPLKDLDDKLYQRLEGLVGNVDLGEEEGFFQRGYTPRYVKGRTRSFGEMLEQAKNGVVAKFGGAAGRSMRKTVDAQKSRRYYNAFDPATGEKKLVYIDKEHNVIAFENGKGTKIGTFGAGQKLAPGSEVKLRALDENGKPVGKSFKWKLDTALTSEIEGQTNQRYLKNVAANRLDLTAKLQSAVRNAEFIEAMKGSPEFDDVAVPVGGHNSVIPETDGRAWRTPKMLQFRNYYMEPKLADALDDYAKNTQLDGIGESLNRIGRLMMNVMFLNPYAHVSNIFNHMIVQGGLVGNIYHSPSTVMSLIKSFRDVYNVSDDYMANLRAGASLKHSEMLTSDLHQKLIEKLGIDAQKDPKAWDGLARAFGYNDTGTMLSRFASVGQRAMWFASDVMTNARMEQEQMLGKSRPEAIADVEKHMPNYRVPGQVLGSRTLAEGLKNPLWTMFGKYDYGRLKSYAALLKEGFGSGVSLTDRAKSFDRMAMIGVYMYAIYPALDKMWQEITGDKNASVVRSGAATIPQIVSDLVTGKKSVIDAAQAVMPTGIPIQLASDYMSGRYAWNGDPIINQSDVNNLRPQAAYDALNYVGSKLSYIGQAGNVMQNKGTASQMGYGLLGVKTPTDAQIKQRAYYKAREDTNAARRAGRLQQQRNNNR
jgi:hypothetical protein